MILSLVNIKGGVGKSTLAINLTACIQQMTGKSCLLVDCDPQASIMHWASVTETHSFDIIHHPEPNLHAQIKTLSKGYVHTILDSPPGTGDISLSVLLASNITAIPVNPSPVDLWATDTMIDLITEARKYNKSLKAFLLISKTRANTKLASEIRPALRVYQPHVPVFRAEIGLRTAFSRSLLAGQAVTEYEPSSVAAAEIKALAKELLKK